MSERRFKITLSFEVAELTPQGDRPFFTVPGLSWTECPAATVLAIERRLLDVLESMHALGLDVLAAKGDPEALARVLRRHMAAGALPPDAEPELAQGPGPSPEI